MPMEVSLKCNAMALPGTVGVLITTELSLLKQFCSSRLHNAVDVSLKINFLEDFNCLMKYFELLWMELLELSMAEDI